MINSRPKIMVVDDNPGMRLDATHYYITMAWAPGVVIRVMPTSSVPA